MGSAGTPGGPPPRGAEWGREGGVTATPGDTCSMSRGGGEGSGCRGPPREASWPPASPGEAPRFGAVGIFLSVVLVASPAHLVCGHCQPRGRTLPGSCPALAIATVAATATVTASGLPGTGPRGGVGRGAWAHTCHTSANPHIHSVGPPFLTPYGLFLTPGSALPCPRKSHTCTHLP